ncbi:sensor histidine kinase [Candidatus Venteria ishoeyi]|uniref:histidine kinase n=1 Tax=Candidatus Venteria ishoeyi TaxID=1899563 RepID=A0A1H6F694_9GAMM|nr:ATP-binding protein [Candidatus Venteria ishoeyi]MDM8545326.1 ATP-binding protein [Candidatus Venteria ishoeyi]SEH04505.1 Autoinducer 2 sensor kinase/phosphatase LuxQ [Candidatus Venteria ishoeyi]SEH07208.1 Autoinducer 2 sensor kinase/phosphatase LuxQ [Candidatus Venteria ishoeyi]
MKTKKSRISKQSFLLITGFLAVLTILLAVTYISLSQVEKANQQLEKLIEKHQKKSELMNTMRNVIRERMLNVFYMTVTNDPFIREEKTNDFFDNGSRFIITRDQLYQLDLSQEELLQLEAQRDVLGAGQNSLGEVVAMIRNGESDITKMREDLLKAQDVNRIIFQELGEMIQVGNQIAEQEVKAIVAKYQGTRDKVILLDIFAVLICILIIAFVIIRIRYQQAALNSAVEALSIANDELESRVLSRTHDLLAARDTAEQANQAKSRFLANMSHELRTPLNAVIGYSEMLMEDAENLNFEEVHNDLEKINNSGKHLLSLINHVLDISKIEAGKMQVIAENFNLHQLVKEIGDTLFPLFEQRHNQFILNMTDEVEFMYSDPMRIRQVLFNLLSNAAKFTKKGSITLTIRKQQRGKVPWLVFNVQDSGIGITKAQQQKIFDAFTQADDSTTRKYGGTGLGLVISERFCHLMGGKLRVESEEGKGSEFIVSLPQSMPEVPDD